MNFDDACRTLGVEAPFTEKELRSAYYRQALEFHPDRNKNEDAAEKFRQAADANVFLMAYLDISPDESRSKETGSESLISTLLKSVFGDPAHRALVLSVCEHIHGRSKEFAVQALENLDHNTAADIIDYLGLYKDVLGIDDDSITCLRERVLGNCSAVKVVLNPTIDNLLNKDVYCLKTDNGVVYVPLWHEEIMYDISGTSLIVTNYLDIPDHITIDHNNDIHIRVRYSFEQALSEQFIPVSVGKKVFELRRDQLYLRNMQTARIKGVGAPRINISSILNANTLGDIVVHLEMY